MADVLVKPAFVSGATDTGDASKLGPNAWNAARLFSAGNDGEVIVRRAASATGAAWEVPGIVAAAAGTLTGATLAPGILASSLTSLGTLSSLTVSGATSFTGILSTAVNGIVTTSTDGFVLENATLATAGVPVQMSPRARLRGTAWGTTGGAAQTVDFFTEALPSTGAVGGGTWRLGYSLAGAAATYPMSLTKDGGLTLLQGLTVSSGGSVAFLGAGYLTGGAATGLFLLRNNTAAAGVGFDVNTDAIFKVRTKVHTGYATVDALGYSVSGVAGASKAAGPVTSITVVNGIVTAIS